MSGVQQAVFQNQRSFAAPPGSQLYITGGTYSWVAPAGVTSVSVVALGSGGGGGSNIGGAGGTLGYKNNYSVTSGSSYTVIVAAQNGGSGTFSRFVNACTLNAPSGGNSSTSQAGNFTGDGGGRGGAGGSFPNGGGGGAGGYSGNGGRGGNGEGSSGLSGAASSGAAGGGGGTPCQGIFLGGGGGGVSYNGKGSTGSGGGSGSGGCGGSGGTGGASNGFGGVYGGGDGGGRNDGTNGFVRIIWPGNTRTFPSTCAGAP